MVSFEMATFSLDDVPAVDSFAPTGFDIDQWMDAVAATGAKYASFICKHHDGWASWATEWAEPGFDPYGIAQTTWYATNQIDLIEAFVTACRARNINPVLYFSVWDKNHEARIGLFNPNTYMEMLVAQLTELLTNYGEIYAIWFDGWKWKYGYDNITFDNVSNVVHSLQPNCLVIDNNHEHPLVNGLIEVYEQPVEGEGEIPEGNTRPSEMASTIRLNGQWVWREIDDQTATGLKSAATLSAELSNALNNNATYHLCITVARDGQLPAAQITLLAGISV